MCGFAGWFGPPGSDAEALASAVDGMAATLVHRGPDDEGRWTDAAAGIGFGFRRLSVVDVSPAGHQPMLSADGRYVCVFNGEIYNHRDLRAELAQRGARFRGASDTEVLVEAAAAFGAEAAVPKLSGMFALGLWDRRERSLLLARDRLGKKPLYVTQLGAAGWLVASELKAFHAFDGFAPEVDADSAAQFLRFGYLAAPRAIYRNTWQLEPGTFSLLRCGEPVRTVRYWNPRQLTERAARTRRSEPARVLVSELDALLRDAVARRMIADVPLGALLSGGIDSSVVTALMQAASTRPVRTFSIGFRHREYDEAPAAEAVARHLGTDHSSIHVESRDALDVVPELPEYYDEPFADASQIPTLLVSRLARQHVTVALSGDGGDEVFAGYNRYRRASLVWGSMSWLPYPVRRFMGGLLSRIPPGWLEAVDPASVPGLRARLGRTRLSETVPRAGRLLARVRSADELYWNVMSHWADPDTTLADCGSSRVTWESAPLDPRIHGFRERMTLYDLLSYLPDDILVKVDRASMATSLEVRSPLLDHRIVEWAWRLPFAMRHRRGATKWILRQVLHRYVPATLVERPKAGFNVPLDHWLRGPLREWADDLLRPARIEAAGLRPAPILDAWRRQLVGGAEHQRLWIVLMWLGWRERWA